MLALAGAAGRASAAANAQAPIKAPRRAITSEILSKIMPIPAYIRTPSIKVSCRRLVQHKPTQAAPADGTVNELRQRRVLSGSAGGGEDDRTVFDGYRSLQPPRTPSVRDPLPGAGW